MKWLSLSLLPLFALTQFAHAGVSLVDKDDWKIQMSGFVEADLIHDSTRSFNEVAGNSPVAKSGSIAHNNGQTAMSMRNSRIAFTVMPPMQNDWKTKGHLEYDLLGYDPKPANAGVSNSEAGFYSNPTLRVRHAFFNAEKGGWTYLMGQTWTLFGWQPNYVLTTASVPPGPGILYQRSMQILAMKTLALSASDNLQVAASLGRPSQRDSERPNIDVGVRWANSGWTSGFASPSGDVKAEPLSVGLSATFRQFATAKTTSGDSDMATHQGQGLAANVLIPILPAREGVTAGSLTFTAEISAGSGYADEFAQWGSGQMNTTATPGSADANTNLDGGQGGYDGSGSFRLIHLRTWNAQLQYQLPGEMQSFVTLGYSKFDAMRAGGLTPAQSYDASRMMFANIFHDCTKQIRIAAEYAKFTTHYIQGESASNDRFQLSGYFRF